MIAHVGLILFTLRTLKTLQYCQLFTKMRVELSTDSPESDKEMLILSASPAQDSIKVDKKNILVITV